jgi:hypothetical protein
MQQGRGSVGSHKHGVSGHAPRSPRYKLMQTLEDNKRRAEARERKPKPRMVSTIADLFAQPRTRSQK